MFSSKEEVLMTDVPHRVLVPIEILRGETISERLIETFASVPVVLLGYHEIPEQTAPEQARDQFEQQAQTKLDALVSAFEAAGGTVASRLVFTRNPLKSFERISAELDCDAVLLLNPAPVLERVLVPVRGDINSTHIATLVGAVLTSGDASVTLFHVLEADDERSTVDTLLAETAETLRENGVNGDRIEQTVVEADNALAAIGETAPAYDLVVIGESRPKIRDRIFGTPSKTLAAQTVSPVLIVRRRYLEMSEDELEERVEDLEETADEFETAGGDDADGDDNGKTER